MADISKATATLARRNLHKKSGFAVALALKEGARRLPPGPRQVFIAKKSVRCENCAAHQHNRILTRKGQPTVVLSSNTMACHGRECISCEAKRANALAADTIDLMEYVWRLSPGARGSLLTLTTVNRALDQTRAMLLDHQKATKAFFEYQRITTSTLGQFGNIEVAFENRNGVFFAHVHSHHILMVEPGAFSDHRYIRQAEYVALWQRALGVRYKPVVDIRAIKNRDGDSTDPYSIRGGIRETCKYCLDTESFIQHEHGTPLVRPELAVAFALAVHRRRLTSMTGIFLAAKKLRAQERREKPAPDTEIAE